MNQYVDFYRISFVVPNLYKLTKHRYWWFQSNSNIVVLIDKNAHVVCHVHKFDSPVFHTQICGSFEYDSWVFTVHSGLPSMWAYLCTQNRKCKNRSTQIETQHITWGLYCERSSTQSDFLCVSCSTKPKTPVRDNGYHNGTFFKLSSSDSVRAHIKRDVCCVIWRFFRTKWSDREPNTSVKLIKLLYSN